MISAWWWAGLAVAGAGAVLLGVVQGALRAELTAVQRATRSVDAARAAIAER